MTWTMPHRALQIVAFVLAAAAAAAFASGMIGSLSRGGRLPGERVLGVGGPVPVDAEDAAPLSQERIEGPPPQEKKPAGNTEADDEESVGETTAAGNAPVALPALPPPPVGNTTPVGNAAATDEPPH